MPVAGTEYTFDIDGLASGLAGTLGHQLVYAASGALALPRITDTIVEAPAGTGIYHVTRVLPAQAGQYTVIWDTGGATPEYFTEALTVDPAPPPPITPPPPWLGEPSAADVRAWLPNIDWAGRGYGAPAANQADPLDLQVGLAVDYVQWVTGRALDATLPTGLIRAAQMAVALRTVQQLADTTEDQADAMAEGDVLASFSADGYSENYRDTGVAAEAQGKARMVNPWPPLNRLLWMLMTPERMAWWVGFLAGGGIPAYGVVEMDWSGASRYGVPTEAGDGGLPGDWDVTRHGDLGLTNSIPGNTLGGDGPLD